MKRKIEELKDFILSQPIRSWHYSLKKNEELFKLFLEVTSPAVKHIENPSLGLRKKILFEGIYEPPTCPVCGGYIITEYVDASIRKFSVFCSKQCKMSDKGKLHSLTRYKDTNLKKYGVEHPLQSEKIKEKMKDTNLKRHGVEYAAQSEDVKEKIKRTNLEKYGVENPSQIEEIKNKKREIMLERYGVENPTQSIEIKEKIKETCLERYGVENPAKSEEVKEKVKETCLKRYGVEHPLQSEKIKEKRKETMIERYEVEYPMQSDTLKEKIRETMLDRYGVENPSQSEEIREKRKETCFQKFGVESPLHADEIKEKIKKTCHKKYGSASPLQSEEIREKATETCLKKYGVKHPLQSDEVQAKIKKTNLKKFGTEYYRQSQQYRIENLKKLKKFMKKKNLEPLFSDEDYLFCKVNDNLKYKCLTCNNEYYVNNNPSVNKGLYHYNFLCTCSKYRSRQEIELAKFLESINITFKNNDKPLKNKYELDLFMPEHSLGIEHNGMYWHSSPHKTSIYHQEKYLFFKEHNIDVIQIFENEWEKKQDIVKSLIKRRLGKSDYILTSEETELKEVTYKEYLNFLEENSIYPLPFTSPSQILGLYSNDTLVQLLALNNSDILAYTTKLDYSITNGLYKLLSNIKKDLSISLDLRYSTGQEFIDCGFTPIQITEPNCLYTDLKEIYKTESANSHKIYDCGNLILAYKK